MSDDFDDLLDMPRHGLERTILARVRLAKNKAGILLGEKTFGNDDVEITSRDDQHERRQQRRQLMAQDKPQSAVVNIKEPSEKAFGDLIEATRPVKPLLLQKQRAQHRRQRQRDKGRSYDCHRHRDREFTEQPADDAAHEKQRDEDCDQRKGNRDDREADLPRPFEGGIEGALPLLDVTHDVLDHDDRIVDDKTDRDRQRHQRNVIEAVADGIHHPKGGEQRQRHGQARDHRRPQRPQKHEDDDDHEPDRQHHRKLDIMDRRLDDERAV